MSPPDERTLANGEALIRGVEAVVKAVMGERTPWVLCLARDEGPGVVTNLSEPDDARVLLRECVRVADDEPTSTVRARRDN